MVEHQIESGLADWRWTLTLVVAIALGLLAVVAERTDFLNPGLHRYLMIALIGVAFGAGGVAGVGWRRHLEESRRSPDRNRPAD